MNLQKLKYPIGTYRSNKNPNIEELENWIRDIEHFPVTLENLVKDISDEALSYKYRPDGWTIKQVVHHCSDSHLNSIMRFKLALTEDTPRIRPYFEDRWAKLPDSLQDDVSDSLSILKGLHKKWVLLLKSLSEEQLKLEFIHPEHGQKFNLAETIGNYAWHCNHHLAHIKNALASKGKYA